MDLDFQDYTPSRAHDVDAPGQIPPISGQQQPSILIRIPEEQTSNTTGGSNTSSALNILQSVANNLRSSGVPDESVKQLAWAYRQKQQQSKSLYGSSSTWGLGLLAQYFDVSSDDVLKRIIWSAIPLRKSGIDLDDSEITLPLTENIENLVNNHNNMSATPSKRSYSYIERFIQTRPDLYGPFWISTTLIFAVAIFSNLASFTGFKSKMETINSDEKNLIAISNSLYGSNSNLNHKSIDGWHYSMSELNTSASVVMFYAIIMPTFVWSLFWFRGCTKYYTLIETICAYGYSMSIFIPMVALLMVQQSLFRYIIFTLASLSSGIVLMMSFSPVAKSDPNPTGSHMLLMVVPMCQFGFAYLLHRITLI